MGGSNLYFARLQSFPAGKGRDGAQRSCTGRRGDPVQIFCVGRRTEVAAVRPETVQIWKVPTAKRSCAEVRAGMMQMSCRRLSQFFCVRQEFGAGPIGPTALCVKTVPETAPGVEVTAQRSCPGKMAHKCAGGMAQMSCAGRTARRSRAAVKNTFGLVVLCLNRKTVPETAPGVGVSAQRSCPGKMAHGCAEGTAQRCAEGTAQRSCPGRAARRSRSALKRFGVYIPLSSQCSESHSDIVGLVVSTRARNREISGSSPASAFFSQSFALRDETQGALPRTEPTFGAREAREPPPDRSSARAAVPRATALGGESLRRGV